MPDVPSRELRNDTRGVLARVEAGEHVTITRAGRPVAVLRPVGRVRWLARSRLARLLAPGPDAALRADLEALAPDTTDDLPWE
jgi:prevent-host-death family protein